jgi:hypothetical protein
LICSTCASWLLLSSSTIVSPHHVNRLVTNIILFSA